MSEQLRGEFAGLMEAAIVSVGHNCDLLRVLIKLGTNILNVPHDERKRKLRASNPKVITSILRPQGGVAALQAMGFLGRGMNERGDTTFLVLPQDAPLTVVSDGVEALQRALAALTGEPIAPVPTTPAAPPPCPDASPHAPTHITTPSTSAGVVITYNCTAGYQCDMGNITQGIKTATRFMSAFPCCVYIFGTCDGKYTDTNQLADYNQAKGFPCPGPLATACTNADNADNVSQVRALVRTGKIHDWMVDDYSSPPSLVQRIQQGEVDIYASNTDGPPGSRSMLVLCNPHKMQSGELEGRMIHEYTHVFQEFSIAATMRKHKCDGRFCDVTGEKIPVWIVEGHAELSAWSLQTQSPHRFTFKAEMQHCFKRIKGFLHTHTQSNPTTTIRNTEGGQHLNGQVLIPWFGSTRHESLDRIFSYDHGVWGLLFLLQISGRTVTQFRDEFFPALNEKPWRRVLLQFSTNSGGGASLMQFTTGDDKTDLETFYQQLEGFLKECAQADAAVLTFLDKAQGCVSISTEARQSHPPAALVDERAGRTASIESAKASSKGKPEEESAFSGEKKQLSDKQKALLARFKKKK